MGRRMVGAIGRPPAPLAHQRVALVLVRGDVTMGDVTMGLGELLVQQLVLGKAVPMDGCSGVRFNGSVSYGYIPSRYQPLADFLTALPPETLSVTLTLPEIEVLLGQPLPRAASTQI